MRLNYSKMILQLYHQLQCKQVTTLIRLCIDHCDLNHYLHQFKLMNDFNCTCEQNIKTVKHFLLDCRQESYFVPPVPRLYMNTDSQARKFTHCFHWFLVLQIPQSLTSAQSDFLESLKGWGRLFHLFCGRFCPKLKEFVNATWIKPIFDIAVNDKNIVWLQRRVWGR